MKITKLAIKNFKGVVNATYEFSNKVSISGANGTGKSTILDAINWVLINKDYNLAKPMVAPITNMLSATEVEMTIEKDGKEYTLSKMQTRTPKGYSMSENNTFTFNTIPMNQTKFKEALEDELDFDEEIFLAISNPEYFFKQTTDKKRELIMLMANSISYTKIAEELGITELASELNKFSLADIKARTSSNKKDYEKQVGKDFSIINAKLDVLRYLKDQFVNAKVSKNAIEYVNKNISEIEAMRKRYSQLIADCERTLSQIEKVEQAYMEHCHSEINSKFNNVGFQLWTQTQNGDNKPSCVPIIDGYLVGESTNTARTILAKVSIMNGISDYYKADYPMFIDNCEALDKTSIKAINSDRQVFMAKVSNTGLKVN